jgi:hypothetical protein
MKFSSQSEFIGKEQIGKALAEVKKVDNQLCVTEYYRFGG